MENIVMSVLYNYIKTMSRSSSANLGEGTEQRSNMLEKPSDEPQAVTPSQKTPPSMAKFGWHKLESGPLVQYINRGNEKYVASSLLDTKVTPPEIFDFSIDVFNCLPPCAFTMTADEAAAFNYIDVRHCDRQLMGNHTLAEGDPMMRLEDVDKVISFYRSCSLLVIKRQRVNPHFGFIRIAGEQLVPFIRQDEVKLVPMFYFDGQSEFLEERSVEVRDDWMLAGFRFCCLLQKIRKELYNGVSVKMVDLEHVKTLFPAETTFEIDFPTSVNEKIFSDMFKMVRDANKAHNSEALNNGGSSNSSSANPLIPDSITPRNPFPLEGHKTNTNSPSFQQKQPSSNQFFVSNSMSAGKTPNVTLIQYNNTIPNQNDLRGMPHQMNSNFSQQAPQIRTSQNKLPLPTYQQHLASLSRNQLHNRPPNQNPTNNPQMQYPVNGLQHSVNPNIQYTKQPPSHHGLSNVQFSNNKPVNPQSYTRNQVASPSNRNQVQYPMSNTPNSFISQVPVQKSDIHNVFPPNLIVGRYSGSEMLKHLSTSSKPSAPFSSSSTSTNRIPSNVGNNMNSMCTATGRSPLDTSRNIQSNPRRNSYNINLLDTYTNGLSKNTSQNHNRRKNSLEIFNVNDGPPAVGNNLKSTSNITINILPTPGSKRPSKTSVIVDSKKAKTQEVSSGSNHLNQTNPLSLRTPIDFPQQQSSTNVPYKSPLAGSSPIHRQPSPFMLEANQNGRVSSAVPNAQFYGHISSSYSSESSSSTPSWPICYKLKGERFCQCPKCDMMQKQWVEQQIGFNSQKP
ncbi:putative uncharacterized protein DDB_G0282133 isoform X1 [Sitophilus oryzae]|uniref:Uncharacterized protein n=1 Tax=Sitophilus oryzae TaxID=7048 RepID=A0A6J2Y6T2_SITOR|nr:putative uncharacterized protein DDB_G0282133 isoform X1 [Sitophilus oryzae]